MTRVFNFSAGPAALPEPVLRQAADEMLDWHGSGMSVMEMSHRGKEFIGIYEEAIALLRDKDVTYRLFDTIGPAFSDVQGGYTRVLKLGPRQGDAADMVLLELTRDIQAA